MKRYVLANIKIPIIVNEDGLFDMLNEYTQTEITSLNQLPAIEEEDNLYKKLMEFLSKNEDLEEEPVQKIKIKDDIEGTSDGTSDGTSEETSEGSHSCFATKGSHSCEATKATKGSHSCEATKATKGRLEEEEEETNETVEQVLTICKNNIKMRKHSDNMTFKNIKKGKKSVKSYTRKTYE